MSKKIKAKTTLHIPAGQANPAPPLGPSLASFGINIAEFCQAFNEQTQDKLGYTVPVQITVYEDGSYEFKVKSPLTSELLKKAAGIEKGSGEPNRRKVGKITREKLREIAQIKLPDLNTQDIEKAMKIIEGTARNMGIEIVD